MTHLADGFNSLYPTPILYERFPVDYPLTSLASDMMVCERDLNYPTVGEHNIFSGDMSESLCQFREEVVWPTFERYMVTVAPLLSPREDCVIKGWVNDMHNGYNMAYHNHANAIFSAVFYILVMNGQGGRMTFVDPRVNANRGYDGMFDHLFAPISHTPSTGDIIVFPSFLYHYVTAFTGALRICIPVDLFLKPK